MTVLPDFVTHWNGIMSIISTRGNFKNIFCCFRLSDNQKQFHLSDNLISLFKHIYYITIFDSEKSRNYYL